MSRYRNADLAKIHIAPGQTGVDEDTHRQIIRQVSGGRTDSAGDLDDAERDAVIHRYLDRGWKPRPAKAAGTRRLASSPQARAVRSLWLGLADLGEVKQRSEAAILAWVRGHDDLAAADSLDWVPAQRRRALIEELKQWTARVERARARPKTKPTAA